jgi:aminoglycoside phosphotransferase (APT) family kinase protein
MVTPSAKFDDPTTEVRPGMELDIQRLDAYLRDHVDGYAGPLAVRQFKGGQSNPTYLLVTPGKRYVLRRKPPGQLLASAHAVDREYRVLNALGQHSNVPVAKTYALCRDDSVIGTWFFVMDNVEGRIFWDPSFPEVSREERPRYFDAMNAALASLHNVDPQAANLSDYGKPAGYLPRQVERWSKQYRQDEAAGRVAALEKLIEWLPRHLPKQEQPAAIVHGDYRADNLIFHPTEPRVVAILDWELSTLGDPLADFAYHLMAYRMPTLGVAGLAGKDLPALNIPSESQYVQAYCARTGRSGIEDLNFYVAFCMFRLAGIMHGIRGRVARGTAVSARARDYANQVETLSELAWQQVAGTGA